jgi:hypothetical protein
MAKRYDCTNPPDFAAAYRAAGRTREANTLERAASASPRPQDAWEIPTELLDACRQLKVLQDQARSLGMFMDDRELLRCDVCGLEEDVLGSGILVTRQAGDMQAPDTGLRFMEVGARLFACPRCEHQVVLVEKPLDLDGESFDEEQS